MQKLPARPATALQTGESSRDQGFHLVNQWSLGRTVLLGRSASLVCLSGSRFALSLVEPPLYLTHRAQIRRARLPGSNTRARNKALSFGGGRP